MKDLHRAALTRAYRTFAQGLAGSGVITALVAVIAAISGDADTLKSALLAAAIALGTVVVTAFGSFWQGVAGGLPEASQIDDDRAAIGIADDDDTPPQPRGYVSGV